MIKLLHCADIHLGSPLAGLPADMREERRRELRATFGRMADYASEGGFAGILICGDAFDSDRPLKKDKEYFYNIVKLHPSLDFFYLRGNHDVGQSYTESLPNLKTFGTEWSYYTYGDVVVAGIELCESNFYAPPQPRQDKYRHAARSALPRAWRRGHRYLQTALPQHRLSRPRAHTLVQERQAG